jgi:hypothetical protein
MMRFVSILLLFISTAAWSQYAAPKSGRKGSAYQPGTYVATLGIGFANSYRSDYSVPVSFEKGNTTGFAPLFAKLEYGLTPHFSMAIAGAYNVLYFNSFHLYPGYNGDIKRYTADQFRIMGIGLNGFYHFTGLFHNSRLDPFIAFGAGINNIRNTALPQGDSVVMRRTQSVTAILKVGARYYISDKVGVYADAGYDKLSIVNVGISCRFAAPRKK